MPWYWNSIVYCSIYMLGYSPQMFAVVWDNHACRWMVRALPHKISHLLHCAQQNYCSYFQVLNYESIVLGYLFLNMTSFLKTSGFSYSDHIANEYEDCQNVSFLLYCKKWQIYQWSQEWQEIYFSKISVIKIDMKLNK